MCTGTTRPPHERTLWWVLVSYFRNYPPLVQGEGLETGPKDKRSSGEETPKAKRPPIRIYW